MKTKHHTVEAGKVKLCGVQGCCPTLDFTGKRNVVITDDFGGKVQLTRKQWQNLKDKFAQQPSPG